MIALGVYAFITRYRSEVINNAIHYLAQMQRLLIKGLQI